MLTVNEWLLAIAFLIFFGGLGFVIVDAIRHANKS